MACDDTSEVCMIIDHGIFEIGIVNIGVNKQHRTQIRAKEVAVDYLCTDECAQKDMDFLLPRLPRDDVRTHTVARHPHKAIHHLLRTQGVLLPQLPEATCQGQ